MNCEQCHLCSEDFPDFIYIKFFNRDGFEISLKKWLLLVLFLCLLTIEKSPIHQRLRSNKNLKLSDKFTPKEQLCLITHITNSVHSYNRSHYCIWFQNIFTSFITSERDHLIISDLYEHNFYFSRIRWYANLTLYLMFETRCQLEPFIQK